MTPGSLAEFSEDLDRLGPELDQWPARERTRAQQLLAASAEADHLLREAVALNALLNGLPELPAPGSLAARILAATEPTDWWQHVLNWFTSALWRPVLAGALPLLIGFLIGFNTTTSNDLDLAEEISLMAFTTNFDEYADGQ